ncbi:hypothetical protein PR048_001070 [Dryococelus australis]|uniref:Uncharacterized protein n=1 Tax=Dryococelus australis TaxID=614101 RepID=A0ABQ9IGZ0_9NEOP|nr:hypothetical protein PR048_001070 [Dryococelus australis]
MSADTRQKAKSKYRNRIRLESVSQKQSSDTHKIPYDRVKRCLERNINIKASERLNPRPIFLLAGSTGMFTNMTRYGAWRGGSVGRPRPRLVVVGGWLRNRRSLYDGRHTSYLEGCRGQVRTAVIGCVGLPSCTSARRPRRYTYIEYVVPAHLQRRHPGSTWHTLVCLAGDGIEPRISRTPDRRRTKRLHRERSARFSIKTTVLFVCTVHGAHTHQALGGEEEEEEEDVKAFVDQVERCQTRKPRTQQPWSAVCVLVVPAFQQQSRGSGGKVVRTLASHPVIRIRYPAGSLPDFRMWESCWTIPHVAVFLGVLVSCRFRYFPTEPFEMSIFKGGYLPYELQYEIVRIMFSIPFYIGNYLIGFVPVVQDYFVYCSRFSTSLCKFCRSSYYTRYYGSHHGIVALYSCIPYQPMRVIEVSMEQRRNEKAGETGDSREYPLTNGIIRHNSHMRTSGSEPTGDGAYGAASEYIGLGNREIPVKTHRPAASSGTIPKCENPRATPPGIERGSPWREATSLTTIPPRPRVVSKPSTPPTEGLFVCALDVTCSRTPFQISRQANRFRFPTGSSCPRIFACGSRAGRCRWSVGFSRAMSRFSPPLHSGAAPFPLCFTLIGSQDLCVKSRPKYLHSLSISQHGNIAENMLSYTADFPLVQQ